VAWTSRARDLRPSDPANGCASLRGAAQDAAVADVARGFVATRASARSSIASCSGNASCTRKRATQPSRVLGGLGSLRRHACHPRAIARRRALHGSSSSSKTIVMSGTLHPRAPRERRRSARSSLMEKPRCSRTNPRSAESPPAQQRPAGGIRAAVEQRCCTAGPRHRECNGVRRIQLRRKRKHYPGR